MCVHAWKTTHMPPMAWRGDPSDILRCAHAMGARKCVINREPSEGTATWNSKMRTFVKGRLAWIHIDHRICGDERPICHGDAPCTGVGIMAIRRFTRDAHPRAAPKPEEPKCQRCRDCPHRDLSGSVGSTWQSPSKLGQVIQVPSPQVKAIPKGRLGRHCANARCEWLSCCGCASVSTRLHSSHEASQ